MLGGQNAVVAQNGTVPAPGHDGVDVGRDLDPLPVHVELEAADRAVLEDHGEGAVVAMLAAAGASGCSLLEVVDEAQVVVRLGMKRPNVATREARCGAHQQRKNVALDGGVERQHVGEVGAEVVDQRRVKVLQVAKAADREVDGGLLVDVRVGRGVQSGGLEDTALGVGGVEAGDETWVGVKDGEEALDGGDGGPGREVGDEGYAGGSGGRGEHVEGGRGRRVAEVNGWQSAGHLYGVGDVDTGAGHAPGQGDTLHSSSRHHDGFELYFASNKTEDQMLFYRGRLAEYQLKWSTMRWVRLEEVTEPLMGARRDYIFLCPCYLLRTR